MIRNIATFVLVASMFVSLFGSIDGKPQYMYRVCYFPNWAQYRKLGGSYKADLIDASLCSHIIIAFVNLDENKLGKTEWNDDATYKTVLAKKNPNPDLKVMVSVGGASGSLQQMSKMLTSARSRNSFIQSSIRFLRQNNLDGIDLDFEYPGKEPDSIAEDKQRFSQLVQEFRVAIDQEMKVSGKEKLILSAAVFTYVPTVMKAYEIEKISKDLDFINLLSYDYHGVWNGKTGHNAPLYEKSQDGPFGTNTNVHYAVDYWVRQGAPKEKLVVGMPLYGRGFLLSDTGDTSIGASISGPSEKQTYTGTEQLFSYYEICDYMSLVRDFSVVRDPVSQVPYFFSYDLWVSYDDQESLRNKVRWLKNQGYGGYMVWEMSLDDFSGAFCNLGKYPLLTALSDELRNSNDLPLPKPSYLSEEKCGPCVSMESGYDCDENDPGKYHQCGDGLVIFTSRCQQGYWFDPSTDDCIQSSEGTGSCGSRLNRCGYAPDYQKQSEGTSKEPEGTSMEPVGTVSTRNPNPGPGSLFTTESTPSRDTKTTTKGRSRNNVSTASAPTTTVVLYLPCLFFLFLF